ncbi:MAG: hypothetical protein R3B92_02440 [Patescibacteria group bacterium]|uniref:Uncharacterized protein n=1 Tax=candidate division WWE3 bacterium TaxID=2053526 RepID=A0A955EAN9_UNCKA|nr:hypothetical protein [candidate division WWE3 bacterium]
MEQSTTKNIEEIIATATRIALIPSKISGADAFTAGVGLFNMLEEKGKNVTFIYKGEIPEGTEGLLEQSKIMSKVDHRDLIISIDFTGTEAEKVKYQTIGNKLEFRVGPFYKDFDRSRISFDMASFDFDVVIVLGLQRLEDLGSIYTHLNAEFNKAQIINIDNTTRNTRFGHANVIDASAHNLSHLVFNRSLEWGLTPNVAAAKALLTGIANKEKTKVSV